MNRTRVQPAGVARVGTREQLPRRAKADAKSLRAPYRPLTSEPDDGTDAMDVDDDGKGSAQKGVTSAEVKDPTIVRLGSHHIYIARVLTC
jgi:hypothetical protein